MSNRVRPQHGKSNRAPTQMRGPHLTITDHTLPRHTSASLSQAYRTPTTNFQRADSYFVDVNTSYSLSVAHEGDEELVLGLFEHQDAICMSVCPDRYLYLVVNESREPLNLRHLPYGSVYGSTSNEGSPSVAIRIAIAANCTASFQMSSTGPFPAAALSIA